MVSSIPATVTVTSGATNHFAPTTFTVPVTILLAQFAAKLHGKIALSARTLLGNLRALCSR
jgi:hypothetical protein